MSDKLSCGCPRIYSPSLGHSCIEHDEAGRRWESYTADEVAAAQRLKVEVQTDTTGWQCACGRHGVDDEMAVGTKCWWNQVAVESDEWECKCLDAERDEWLSCVTTDWHAMAKAEGYLA